MKDILSPPDEISPLPRAAEAALADILRVMPVAVVTGARQTGKSTLVAHHPLLRGVPCLTLDDLEVREQARRDPHGLVGRAEPLVLDEVQRAPDLLLAVKKAVDEGPRRAGRFVLTGSANLLLMEKVSESLAGRAAYLKLWPLTRRERLGLGSTGAWSALLATPWQQWPDLVAGEVLPADDWRTLAAEGGMPVPSVQLDSPGGRQTWFGAYLDTYLERDLQVLARIEELGDFRRLMRAASLRVGTVLNQAELARDVALSGPTTHRWLNLLETTYQIVRVEAYSVNRTRRIVKSPKLYWSDVGVALHLAGVEPTGAHLENLVLSDLVAWRELHPARPEILYWRTHRQEEVDFVIEAGRRLLPIEVKATSQPRFDDARHLVTFLGEYPEADAALLLHCGTETFWLTKRVLATPWWTVL